VLVVDDEAIARRRAVDLLRDAGPATVVGECRDGREAVDAIRELEPDVVLLDVAMPEMDGFEVIREVGAHRMPPVVFVTAFDQHAVAAFELHAVDYLVKPYDAPRLREALRRVRARAASGRAEALAERLSSLLGAPGLREPSMARERLLVRVGEEMRVLRADEILWVEADGHYLRIQTAQERLLSRGGLAAMQAQLDPEWFVRIHRSTIVNFQHVRHLRPWFGGDYHVRMADGTDLKLSRTYRESVIQRFPTAGT
jgi:two-component system LytT family response regulator